MSEANNFRWGINDFMNKTMGIPQRMQGFAQSPYNESRMQNNL